jgi:hypothetical protein
MEMPNRARSEAMKVLDEENGLSQHLREAYQPRKYFELEPLVDSQLTIYRHRKSIHLKDASTLQ